MYIKILQVLVIAGLNVACIYAQSTSPVKWTRVETENKEVSVALPAGFLVDAEKTDGGRTHRIFASAGMTMVEVRFLIDKAGRNKVKIPPQATSEGAESFKAFGLDGTRSCSAPGKRVSCTVILASDQFRYIFLVSSLSEKPEIATMFLSSIMVDGKLIFTGESATVSETVQLSQLSTSTEIKEAMGRALDERLIKVTRRRMSEYTEDKELPETVKPVLILERPYPTNGIQKIFLNQPPNFGTTRAVGDVIRGGRARVTFLASGQIGDIVIYSDENKGYIEDCVNAVKKIKFIPAQENGKPVDSVQTVSYALNFM
jgi:hypothetical protein